MATLSKIGKLSTEKTLFFCCDIQDKFRPVMKHFPRVLDISSRLMKAAAIMKIPVIITEHYPAGLGHTCKELNAPTDYVFSKTLFSMLTPEVKNVMATKFPSRKSVIIFGLEAHVCVQQTVLDLLESKEYEVHVLGDTVISRSDKDYLFAIERMKNAGAFISTYESSLFMLMKEATYANFKEVQNLVKKLPEN